MFRWCTKVFRDGHLARLQSLRSSSTYSAEIQTGRGIQHALGALVTTSGSIDAAGLSSSLQQLWQHAHRLGDQELADEVHRTMQLYGVTATPPPPSPSPPTSGTADPAAQPEAVNVARMARGLARGPQQQANTDADAAEQVTVSPFNALQPTPETASTATQQEALNIGRMALGMAIPQAAANQTTTHSATAGVAIETSSSQAAEVTQRMRDHAHAQDVRALKQQWHLWQRRQRAKQPAAQQAPQDANQELLADLQVASCYTQALATCIQRSGPQQQSELLSDILSCLKYVQQRYKATTSSTAPSSSSTSTSSAHLTSPAHSSQQPEQLLRSMFKEALYLHRRLRRHQQLQPLLREMHSCGLRPSCTTYKELMKSAVMQQQPPEALELLLHEMMGTGLLPLQCHYDQLLIAYARHGDAGAAHQVLQRALALGLLPAARQYNHVIMACSYARDLPAAAAAYDEMRAAQVPPDEQTYQHLFCAVRLAVEKHRMQAARQLNALARDDWQRRREVLNRRSTHFNSAYELLARWQQHMVAAQLAHSEASLWHLIKALERLSRLADCLQLVQKFDELRPGNHKPHSAAIKMSVRSGETKHVALCMQLIGQLEQRGRLSQQEHLALMSAQAWLHRDVGKVQAALARMKAAGYHMDSAAYEALVQEYCRMGQWQLAVATVKEMVARGVVARDSVWHVCLRHVVWSEAPAHVAASLLEVMPAADRHRFEQLYVLQSAGKAAEAEQELMAEVA